MSDRELIEQAAKAVGRTIRYNYLGGQDANSAWDPLVDSAEALELAAELGLSVHVLDLAISVSQHGGKGYLGGWMHRSVDDAADYRRAIVLGAAELGRAM